MYLSYFWIRHTGLHLTLSASFRTAKQILSDFYQIFTSSVWMYIHGIQIRWNFCEIFFRFKDRTFYLVFDFFNSAQTFYI